MIHFQPYGGQWYLHPAAQFVMGDGEPYANVISERGGDEDATTHVQLDDDGVYFDSDGDEIPALTSGDYVNSDDSEDEYDSDGPPPLVHPYNSATTVYNIIRNSLPHSINVVRQLLTGKGYDAPYDSDGDETPELFVYGTPMRPSFLYNELRQIIETILTTRMAAATRMPRS